MTSMRKANRRFERWNKYYRKYPWHYATPGMLRAYDRIVAADYAKLRRS